MLATAYTAFSPFFQASKSSLTHTSLFTAKPWDVIGWTRVAVYPFVLGLVYYYRLISFSDFLNTVNVMEKALETSTVATLLLTENVDGAKLKICVPLLENCELDLQIVPAKRRN